MFLQFQCFSFITILILNAIKLWSQSFGYRVLYWLCSVNPESPNKCYMYLFKHSSDENKESDQVATKRGVGHEVGHGVGHGLSYGLPVVNFLKTVSKNNTL